MCPSTALVDVATMSSIAMMSSFLHMRLAYNQPEYAIVGVSSIPRLKYLGQCGPTALRQGRELKIGVARAEVTECMI